MSTTSTKIPKHLKMLPDIPTPKRRPDHIRLDLNESPFLLTDDILSQLSFDPQILGHYPEYDTLKEKLAAYSETPTDHLTVFNGSDAAIHTLLHLFFEKGDSVLLPEPSFFIYRQTLQQIQATIVSIPFMEETIGAVTFPTSAVLEALQPGVAGLLLCNPNNPLSIAIPEPELIQMIDRANELSIPVIVDEAYFEFHRQTVAPLVETYPNLIILRTLSKGFGLAGIRVGYSISHPDVTANLRKIHLPWSISSPSVAIAEHVLDHKESIEEARAALLRRKQELITALDELGITHIPSATNFLLLKVPDAERFANKLLEHQIIVGRTYQGATQYPILTNTVRIAMPAPHEHQTVLTAITTTYEDIKYPTKTE